MGTRHFYPVEQKDSRIKWERADSETSQKLILALSKDTRGLRGPRARFVMLLPFLILLGLLIGFIIKIMRNPGTVDTASIIFSIFCFAFMFIIYFVRYIKTRPYLYPERQRSIWIFRAKCSDINIILKNSSKRKRYYAYFQKGGDHISIPLPWSEHQANPRGKEYIFYKFNNRTGNSWAAIAADKLDSL